MDTGNLEQAIADQRKAFRFPISEDQRNASLEIEGVRHPILLLEESSCGFSIRIFETGIVSQNDVVRLKTNAAWFEVRVVHIRKEEVSATLEQRESYRIGLERLRVLERWDIEGHCKPIGFPWNLLRLPNFSVAFFAVSLLLICGVTVLLIFLASWQPKYSGFDGLRMPEKLAHRLKPSTAGNTYSKVEDSEPEKPWSTKTKHRSKVTPVKSTKWVSLKKLSNSSNILESENGDLPLSQICNLPGVNAFTFPEVVELLGLSKSQVKQLDEITKASDDAILHISDSPEMGSRQKRAELIDQIHRESQKAVLDILNDEQKKIWVSLK